MFLIISLAAPDVPIDARGGELVFGQVYGSAGFVAAEPSGEMTDAPDTVLGFTSPGYSPDPCLDR